MRTDGGLTAKGASWRLHRATIAVRRAVDLSRRVPRRATPSRRGGDGDRGDRSTSTTTQAGLQGRQVEHQLQERDRSWAASRQRPRCRGRRQPSRPPPGGCRSGCSAAPRNGPRASRYGGHSCLRRRRRRGGPDVFARGDASHGPDTQDVGERRMPSLECAEGDREIHRIDRGRHQVDEALVWARPRLVRCAAISPDKET